MSNVGLLTAAVAGYVAYRIGCRIMEENSGGSLSVHRAPPEDIGVDVSARIPAKSKSGVGVAPG